MGQSRTAVTLESSVVDLLNGLRPHGNESQGIELRIRIKTHTDNIAQTCGSLKCYFRVPQKSGEQVRGVLVADGESTSLKATAENVVNLMLPLSGSGPL